MKVQGTIPLFILAVVAAAVISCSQTTDAGITGTIKTRLAADDRVRAFDIAVDTTNGVVTLTGSVDSRDAGDRAMEIARDTSGVRSVKDMMSVRVGSASGDAPDPKRTVGERIDDAGITMRVKGRLLDDPLVKGLQIDVDTRDGVVFLTGTVASAAERSKAIELATSTEGVKSVEANFS